MTVSLIYNQNVNWRTTEFQFLDEDGAPIDITGATGSLVSTDPNQNSYASAITLGHVVTSDASADAMQGWCWATFKGINVSGAWTEQMQLLLPGASEPLMGIVKPFTVSANLVAP